MTEKTSRQEFLFLSLLCIAALFLINWPQLFDPFVRHDDFPALLGWTEIAYHKALDEGRWLNYWWQFRPFLWPSQISMYLYNIAWGLFSAAAAVAIMERSDPIWYKGYLALFIAFSVPAFLISYWFNTLLPGIWVITLYSLAVLFLPHRVSLALLVVAVPLSFMAYTTYPFLLLTLILLSNKAPKTYTSVAVTLIIFFVSLVLALLSVYTLNYFYHGIFGIPVAEWRGPNEVNSVDDLLLNLTKVKVFLRSIIYTMGGGTISYGLMLLALFAGAWGFLFTRRRMFAVAILMAALAGLAPLILKAMMSGVQVPVRALNWLWILFGVVLTTCGVQFLQSSKRWLSVSRILLMCVLMINLMLIGKTSFMFIPPWQKATRALAQSLPEQVETVYIYGHFLGVNGAADARVQFERGLRLRLNYLTGAEIIMCWKQPDRCDGITPPFDPGDWVSTPVVASTGDQAFILLPRPNLGP